MKPQFLPKFLGGTLVCVLGILSGQQAHAQARLDYNVLYGNAVGTGSNFQITVGRSGDPSPYIHMYGNDQGSGDAGSINFISGYNANQGSIAQSFLNRTSSGSWTRTMQILQSGQVQIGTRIPGGHGDYKLAVDGKIVSTALYVTNPNTWADFVFAPSFKLMPLPELESYLKVNHHLPAIPTADDVVTKGYSVAEMDAKLLQSVEELTLHVIELNKQNAQMRTELTSLRRRVNQQASKRKVVGAR